MSKSNIESVIARYIMEHLQDLQISGNIKGSKIINIDDVSLSINRNYDGKGVYAFLGSAYIFYILSNGQMGESCRISGDALVEEGEETPIVNLLSTLSINKMSRL